MLAALSTNLSPTPTLPDYLPRRPSPLSPRSLNMQDAYSTATTTSSAPGTAPCTGAGSMGGYFHPLPQQQQQQQQQHVDASRHRPKRASDDGEAGAWLSSASPRVPFARRAHKPLPALFTLPSSSSSSPPAAARRSSLTGAAALRAAARAGSSSSPLSSLASTSSLGRQAARREAFLGRVKQRSEDQRWQARGGDDEVKKVLIYSPLPSFLSFPSFFVVKISIVLHYFCPVFFGIMC